MYQQFITSYQVSRRILQKYCTLYYLFQCVNVSLFAFYSFRSAPSLGVISHPCLGNYNRRTTPQAYSSWCGPEMWGDTHCLLREPLSDEGRRGRQMRILRILIQRFFSLEHFTFFEEHTTEKNHSCFQIDSEMFTKSQLPDQHTPLLHFFGPTSLADGEGKNIEITKQANILASGQKFSRFWSVLFIFLYKAVTIMREKSSLHTLRISWLDT